MIRHILAMIHTDDPAILVSGPPEAVLLAIDLYGYLVDE
jgi:hypothetical protein